MSSLGRVINITVPTSSFQFTILDQPDLHPQCSAKISGWSHKWPDCQTDTFQSLDYLLCLIWSIFFFFLKTYFPFLGHPFSWSQSLQCFLFFALLLFTKFALPSLHILPHLCTQLLPPPTHWRSTPSLFTQAWTFEFFIRCLVSKTIPEFCP